MNIFHGETPFWSGATISLSLRTPKSCLEKMWPTKMLTSLTVKGNLCPVSVNTAGYANSIDQAAPYTMDTYRQQHRRADGHTRMHALTQG